jgi:hypothetical protein
MPGRLGDAPIEPRLHRLMNVLATTIDTLLNGAPLTVDKQNGFVLLVFPLDGHEGRCNYISNADRADVLTMLKEQVRRFEGQPELKGTA